MARSWDRSGVKQCMASLRDLSVRLRKQENRLLGNSSNFYATTSCPYCPRKFARVAGCKTHILHSHPDRPQPVREMPTRTLIPHPQQPHTLILEASLPFLRLSNPQRPTTEEGAEPVDQPRPPRVSPDGTPRRKKRHHDAITNSMVIGNLDTGQNKAPRTTTANMQIDTTTTATTAFDINPADLQDKYMQLGSLPTVRSRLPPGVAAAVPPAFGRLAEKALETDEEIDLFHFMTLPKVALAPGLRMRTATARLQLHPRVKWPEPEPIPRGRQDPVAKATRLVQQNRLAEALVAVTESSKVAPNTPETMIALDSKFPQGQEDPLREVRDPPPFKTAPDVTPDDILRKVHALPTDAAPGQGGFTADILKLACRHDAVPRLLAHIANRIMRGTAKGHSFLTTTSLTPFAKDDGGVRPINCPDLIMRVCTSTILDNTFQKEMLAPMQFGVGTRGGTEPVIHLVKRALENKLGQPVTHLACFDAVNAFNSMNRKRIGIGVRKYAPQLLNTLRWLLGRPSRMVLRDGDQVRYLECSEGVEQGGVLSPLFFSVGFRDFLEGLQRYLGSSHIVVAYLDDFFVLGPDENINQRVLAYITAFGAPITINETKSKVYSTEYIWEHGIKVLGTVVGSPEAQRRMLGEAAKEMSRKLAATGGMPAQYRLLLMRSCILPSLAHLARSLDPGETKERWRQVDDMVHDFIATLKWAGHQQPSDQTKTITALPLRLGGLALPSYGSISHLASEAATELADHVLSKIIPAIEATAQPTSQKEKCEDFYQTQLQNMQENLNLHDRMALEENNSELGRLWMTTVPASPNLELEDIEIAAALQFRTLDTPRGDPCTGCGRDMIPYHSDSCLSNTALWTTRHNVVKYGFGNVLKSVPNSITEIEPLIDHAQRNTRKNDIRFQGSQERGIPPMEADMAVLSLQAHSARSSINAANVPFTADLSEDARNRADAALDARAKQKINNLPPNRFPRGNFYPIVMSAGGLQEKETKRLLKSLRPKLGPGQYQYMTRAISVGLVRTRARGLINVANLQQLPSAIAPHIQQFNGIAPWAQSEQQTTQGAQSNANEMETRRVMEQMERIAQDVELPGGDAIDAMTGQEGVCLW